MLNTDKDNLRATWRWQNPYIERSKGFSGRLFVGEKDTLSSKELVLLQERVKEYPHLYLEFGSGSGGHLITLAERHAGALCAGFEIRFKRAVRTIEKSDHKNIKNLAVLLFPAQEAPRLFTENSVDGVFINFPDPWDKRRWKKHRLFSEELVGQISRLLKEGGFLSYKTDHEEYFYHAQELLRKCSDFVLERVTNNLTDSEWAGENIVTEFESLFRSRGQPIHYLFARRV